MDKKMAKTYKKQPKEVRVYLDNPSVGNINLTTKTQKKFIKNGNKALLVDESTGEHIGTAGMGAMFLEEREVDTEQFIKLYIAGINELVNLSGAGLKMFKLVYDTMIQTPNGDAITLDFKTLKAKNLWEFSQPTFNTGINELLEREIIFKSISPAQYFINIKYIYNGDRITQVKSYRLKKSKSILENQQELLLE